MKPLEELINKEEPGIDLVTEWLKQSPRTNKLLPPSKNRDNCLYQLQVTTRSSLGTIAYETGGLIVDNGWLRFLGSGHASFRRNLTDWNTECKQNFQNYFLIADDALGGFFALNGGSLGPNLGDVYYLPYDSLEWESLDIGYSAFLQSCLTDSIVNFYGEDHWSNWSSYSPITADESYSFYPFLWSEEGGLSTSHKKILSVTEVYSLKLDSIKQFNS